MSHRSIADTLPATCSQRGCRRPGRYLGRCHEHLVDALMSGEVGPSECWA